LAGYGNAAQGAAVGATNGVVNADSNNGNLGMGALRGAATGGLSSGIDMAGAFGVTDPQQARVLNSTLGGATSSGLNGGKMDTGAAMGLLSGLGNAYGTPALNWLTSSPSGQNTAGQSNGGVSNLGNLVAGLGSLYLSQRAKNANQGQINNLNSLYAPNSPYAQQMQQALDRQDAASGRRSQYGTRQVELQAQLANLNSRNAPMLNQLQQQQRNIDFGQLGSLYKMGQNSGLFNQGAGALRNMFGNSANNAVPTNGAYQDPSLGGMYNNPSAYTAPQAPMPQMPSYGGDNPNYYDTSSSNAYYGG
jgi:hypothetical protein